MADTLKEKLMEYGCIGLVTVGIFGSWGYAIHSKGKNPFKETTAVVRYHELRQALPNLKDNPKTSLNNKIIKMAEDELVRLFQDYDVKAYFDYNKQVDNKAAKFGATAISLGLLSYFGYCVSKRRRK